MLRSCAKLSRSVPLSSALLHLQRWKHIAAIDGNEAAGYIGERRGPLFRPLGAFSPFRREVRPWK